MAGLSPNLSTAGLPRPTSRSVGTSVSSALKTKLSSLKGSKAGSGTKLSSVKMPKSGVQSKYPKLAKNSVKTSKSSSKMSSLQSKLKSIISGAKKNPALAMSSSVGAPASIPSPSFFGSPSAPPSGIGLGMQALNRIRMASIKDMKKNGEITGVDFGAAGPGKPFENSDTTAEIKDKLSRKIGYKNDGSMAPFVTRSLAEYRRIQKDRSKVKRDKLVG